MTTADDLRDLRDALDSIVHGALPRWGKPSTKTGKEAVRAAVDLYEKYIRALIGEGAAQAATHAAKLAESDQREHAAALTARTQELEDKLRAEDSGG
jgi:hypothetical protein